MQKATTRKTSSKTTPTATLQRRATIKPTVPQVRFPSPQESIQRALNTHLTRPSNVQRQMATPALQAAHLYTSEHQQAQHQTASLQRRINELQTALPTNAIQSALQRQAQASTPTQQRPVTPGDWAVTMQREAARIEGKALNTQQHGQFMALQRHVTQTLVQGFRQDRQPAPERYAQYGSHLATLQRHPISGQVAQATMRLIPAGERPLLQRAVDEALQRQQEQEAQDSAAFNLQALQRQLAEQETSNQQSVMQRIQERRGSGNPLPESVQRHLEHGLNHDLSGVRIHDDAEADKMAKGVNAIAFTTGKDIFFQSGKFNPNTQTGLELLAHEVTHTVQQSKGQVGKGIDPDSGLEQEARDMGRKIAHTTPTPHTSNTPVRFGNRQPGALTQARRPLQRTQDTNAQPSIQRWGLGDLKKLTQGGAQRVAETSQAVRNTARKAVAAVKAAPKKLADQVKSVRKAAKARLDSVKRRASVAMTKIQRQVKAKTQSLRRRAGAAFTSTKRKAGTRLNQLNQAARAKLTRLKHQTSAVTKRISKQVKAKYDSVSRRANYGLHKAQTRVRAAVDDTKRRARASFESTKRRAGATLERGKRTLTAKVESLTHQAKDTVERAKQTAKARFTTLKAQAKATWQNSKRRAGATLTQAFRSTKARVTKFLKSRPATSLLIGGGAALAAYQAVKKGGIQELANSVKEKAGAALKWATSPEGKAALTRMAVTVGVGVGAAALTTLTGGLAAPLLIMAAGGAAGGVLGRIAQNKVLQSHGGKYKNLKPTEGVNWKNAAADGLMGAAMGPAGALVGSGTKFAAGNLGRYVLKPGAQAAMRKLGLQGARAGTQATRGGTQAAQASRAARSGTNTTERLQNATWQERGNALLKDMRTYNRKLVAESKADILQSIRGNAGFSGRAQNDLKNVFGGTRALKNARHKVANNAVHTMDHREVIKLARDMRIPSTMKIEKLRPVVASNLVRTNHNIVARPIAKQAIKMIPRYVTRDLRHQVLGAPRRRGETALRVGLRQGGNAITVGMRANYNNLLDKDKAWAEAISRGSGFAYISGNVATETTKAAGLAARTELSKPAEQREPVDLLKAAQDGLWKSSGANPDWTTDKAIPAILGFDQAVVNMATSAGAGGIADNSQYEDAPEGND